MAAHAVPLRRGARPGADPAERPGAPPPGAHARRLVDPRQAHRSARRRARTAGNPVVHLKHLPTTPPEPRHEATPDANLDTPPTPRGPPRPGRRARAGGGARAPHHT